MGSSETTGDRLDGTEWIEDIGPQTRRAKALKAHRERIERARTQPYVLDNRPQADTRFGAAS